MPKNHPDVSSILIRSAADLRALLRYLIEVVELQQHEPDLKNNETAAEFLENVIPVLCAQVDRLDRYLQNKGNGRTSVQQATSAMAGAFLGFITKLRSHETAKILRDDFTLLNLAAVHCLTLHTTATALQETALANIAAENRRELIPLSERIVRLMPQLIQEELARTVGPVKKDAAEQSLRLATQPELSVIPPLAASA